MRSCSDVTLKRRQAETHQEAEAADIFNSYHRKEEDDGKLIWSSEHSTN